MNFSSQNVSLAILVKCWVFFFPQFGIFPSCCAGSCSLCPGVLSGCLGIRAGWWFSSFGCAGSLPAILCKLCLAAWLSWHWVFSQLKPVLCVSSCVRVNPLNSQSLHSILKKFSVLVSANTSSRSLQGLCCSFFTLSLTLGRNLLPCSSCPISRTVQSF